MFQIAIAIVLSQPVLGQVEPSPQSPKNTARKQSLAELDRLAQQLRLLDGAEKLTEAIKVAYQVLEIETDLHGENHKELAGTYAWIADLHERIDQLDLAIRARKSALKIESESLGEGNWRAIDSKLHIRHLECLTEWPFEQRRIAEQGITTLER